MGSQRHFSTPAYQTGAGIADEGRGVPDIAGNADPFTGYTVRVNGQNQVIGGTSAVAPLWAALTALANQRNGAPVGAPHARLYTTPTALRDITVGDNGGYAATAGWDACTGLGTPHGDLVIAAFASVAGPPAATAGPVASARASGPVASGPVEPGSEGPAPAPPTPVVPGGPDGGDSGTSANEFSW